LEYQGTIGFIGGGAMAEALISGVVETKLILPQRILVSDLSGERLDYLKQNYAVSTVSDNAELVNNADLIIFAVKPQVAPKVLAEVGSEIKPNQTVVSIMAGLKISRIRHFVSGEVPLVRVMPNTPCLIREGVCAYSPSENCPPQMEKVVEQLLGAVGEVIRIEEEQMDAVTGLSGGGPAYIYVVMEALVDAGVHVGLSREVAKKLVFHTVSGAAQMALKTGKHIGELKDQVTSPGGTTIAGIRELERGRIRSDLYDCVIASVERSRELGGDK
jgi:pyrroline-5-carboxylate reductase